MPTLITRVVSRRLHWNVISITSSRVSRSPSTSAVMNPPMRSSPGAAGLSAVEFRVDTRSVSRRPHAVVVVRRPDDAVLEPQEERQVVEGQPELCEEDLGGERLAERGLKNSTLPSAMNPSIRSSASARTRGSSVAMTFGAKSGSRSLRYLVWESPSSISGMSGRPAPMYEVANSIIDGSIECTSRRFVTARMSAIRVIVTPLPSRTTRGPSSRWWTSDWMSTTPSTTHPLQRVQQVRLHGVPLGSMRGGVKRVARDRPTVATSRHSKLWQRARRPSAPRKPRAARGGFPRISSPTG